VTIQQRFAMLFNQGNSLVGGISSYPTQWDPRSLYRFGVLRLCRCRRCA
jgi:hypothetical protein